MGYNHSWRLKREEFTETFLDDVKVLLVDYVSILIDLTIFNDVIAFNGRGGYG